MHAGLASYRYAGWGLEMRLLMYATSNYHPIVKHRLTVSGINDTAHGLPIRPLTVAVHHRVTLDLD